MPEDKNKNSRGLLTIILLTMLMIFAIVLFDGMANKSKVQFSDLLNDIQQEKVSSITIKGQDIQYFLKSEPTTPKLVTGPKESDVLLDEPYLLKVNSSFWVTRNSNLAHLKISTLENGGIFILKTHLYQISSFALNE